MAAIAFDTLKYARQLKAAGVPEKQAEAQAEVMAEVMAEAFLVNVDALVTRDYLDARLDARFAELAVRFTEVDGKIRVITWMLAVVMASTVLPALHRFFT